MEGMVDFSILCGKTVLITGHTGFKGSWMAIWLHSIGANVIGYALDPNTNRDNFVRSEIGAKIEADIRGDINDVEKLHEVFEKYQPEIVFHLAAQPLVRLSYDKPFDTYQTNVMGTIRVMEEIRKCKATKVGIMVTTDKCYANREQLWGYRENDSLGGYDPYSSSKGAAEIAINSWRSSFMNPNSFDKHGKSIASVRSGNVIGGGDWAVDRIIPDCIRAIELNKAIEIRSPKSIRPWQHVLEPINGYITLAIKMLQNPIRFSQAWNFGPSFESIIPVWDIAALVIKYYGRGVLLDITDSGSLHEAELLALDITKARFELGWKPCWNIDKTIEKTVEWYLEYQNTDVYQLCLRQIRLFDQERIS